MEAVIFNDTAVRHAHVPRPCISRDRLPTMNGSSAQWFDDERSSTSSEESDTQLTPRASLSGKSAVSQRSSEKDIWRDDTATDLSHMAGPSLLEPQAHDRLVDENSAQEVLRSIVNEERSARPFFQRNARRNTVQRTPSSASLASSSSSSSTTHSNTQLKAASLRKSLSRKYQDKMADLKENIQKHTTSIPSRIRRTSTSASQNAETDVDLDCIVPAVSPSKRNGRHSDFRPKKLRPGFGSLMGSDRNDTPAPPNFGNPLVVSTMIPPSANMPSAWAVEGGDQARRAVAAYNVAKGTQTDGVWSDCDDHSIYQSRRDRMGSVSSAADSAADLSTYSDAQCPDLDGDVSMEDRDPSKSTLAPTLARDFFSVLPREICLHIFEYLDAPTLLRTESICHAWRSLCVETCVWRAAFFNEFNRQIFTNPPPIQVGGVGVGRPNLFKQEWKSMYRARAELERNWRRGVQQAGKAVYLSGHTDSVYCLQFDEEKIITGSRDRTIRVWDINTYECKRVIGGPNVRPVLGPKVLRTVDYPAFHLATASVNGTVYGESIYHTPSQWHDASILCLQYDEKILVTGSSDSDLLIWDIQTYEPIKRLQKHTGGVLDVALDAKHIVSCSKDSRIIVWDRETLEPKGDLTGHQGPVNAVQLRGKYLVSASGDGIARLWDIEQMKLIKEFSAKERGLAAVEFSEDMKYVLAGGNDHITYKFETDTGREVQQFTGHTQLVRSLWLDSANKRVVSGSYDLDLRVYDFVTGQELWRAEEWTTSWMLAAKSDYRRIVATSQDGRILIVDFGLHKGGRNDGEKIENLDLLRGTEHTTEIVFKNPWASSNPNPTGHHTTASNPAASRGSGPSNPRTNDPTR